MNEFASQPNPGQSVWLSESLDSETSESDTDMDEVLTFQSDGPTSDIKVDFWINECPVKVWQ